MSARLSLVPSPYVPTATQLAKLPIARSGEFELSDFETRQTRRLIYSINAQGRFRYRTQRDGPYLQVWRIR